MVTAARRELRAAGVEEVPEVVLADAGYWHQVQMRALAADGVTVLVPPDANKREGARPGWNGGLYAFMRRVLATDRGGALYAKRQAMIEPVFADTKFNRRIDRFLRRGRAAARSEWRLTNAAHNLLKLWRATTPAATPETAAAQAALPDGPGRSEPQLPAPATPFPQQPPCNATPPAPRAACRSRPAAPTYWFGLVDPG